VVFPHFAPGNAREKASLSKTLFFPLSVEFFERINSILRNPLSRIHTENHEAILGLVGALNLSLRYVQSNLLFDFVPEPWLKRSGRCCCCGGCRVEGWVTVKKPLLVDDFRAE